MDCELFLGDRHAKVLGVTRRGKSGLLQHVSRAIVRSARDGMLAVDPHGSFVRDFYEWASNPQNLNLRGRRLEFLEPGCLTHSFSFNVLEIDSPTPAKAYGASAIVTSTVEAFFEESAAETPRLVRLLTVLAYVAALKGLSMRDMLTMISYSGEALREAALHGLADINPLIAGELQELSVLAAKAPARLSEMTESLRNRLLVFLADDRMLRILAGRGGINPRKVMDGRELILADFSTIPTNSARFLGALLTTAFVHAAQQRPPLRCAPFRLLLDEGENLVTNQTARLLDQCAKFGLFLTVAIQRLGQLRAKGDFVFDALMTNCPITVCFGMGQDPEAATYMADALLSPFPLEKWKESSRRAVAVGNQEVILQSRSLSQSHSRQQSRSRADHVAEHESKGVSEGETISHGVADSRGTSRSVGWSRQRGLAISEGDSHSIGSVRGASLGQTDADASGWSNAQGTNNGSSDTQSLTLTPPDMSIMPATPTILGQGQALTNATGTNAMSAQSGSHSSARSSVFSSADSEAFASTAATTHSESEGESESETDSESHTTSSSHAKSIAHSRATGVSRGRSDTTGESQGESRGITHGTAQAFVTKYELLPTQYFSLDEMRHLMMAELMHLPRRDCIVKDESKPAFRTRSTDLTPAYKSSYFKSLMLPLFRKSMLAKSRYLRPVEDIDAEIAARAKQAVEPKAPTPDPTIAEPLPIISQPGEYARAFWRDQRGKGPLPDEQRARFRVVPGKGDVDIAKGSDD